ncbi:sodium/proline symporter [Litorimonas haliclonae]|uniref:sodium/proline symporter n=1 Tax=Litorimonas haliclonae TaxID=2081977 RepID=UPI0039EF6FFA
MSSTTIVLITLIAYKILLLGVGFWAARRVRSEDDFFLAGKGAGGGLGAWTAGLSYAASTSSAWVLLGFTGVVYTQGLVGIWLVPGIFAGYILTWFVMGPKLNVETASRGHLTIVDFITADVNAVWKKRIGIICAAMILFCFIFYISSQFQAAGNALTEVFGMNVTEAVLLGAAVIVIYCLLGGFLAASVTDALQAVVMMIACVLVPIAAVSAAGGIGSLFNTLQATQVESYFSLTGGAPGMVGIGLAMGLFGTGLGALGQPQLLNRIMSVRSNRERLKGATITIVWGAVIYSGLICLAFAGRATGIETGTEALFFAAAKEFLPAVLAGIVTAAILSAVMSTVDSLLLAAASAVSHDVGIKYSHPRRALFFGRVAMVAVAVFAVLLTLFADETIFKRVLFSWVALGAAFGPAVLTKCLGWQVKGGAVLTAILVGFFTAVIFANVEGSFADMVEKWLSWIFGLTILTFGRRKNGEYN